MPKRMEPDDERNEMKDPHEHASGAGAPGASGPGEKAYEGEVTIGTDGGSAHPISYEDPFGRPDS